MLSAHLWRELNIKSTINQPYKLLFNFFSKSGSWNGVLYAVGFISTEELLRFPSTWVAVHQTNQV
jgi:hypothetical protein